ncbi:hypothetical protein GA0115256_13549 [Streptomyces sp. DconLS]|uniref:hypothetical protein n=1 Tax=Streptomyces sp. LamerLS-31b TaxID=1839765 RepID=UPI00081E32FD|nr:MULTISPECIES: hypothetical protein [unclassified Streptomyces]SCF94567.1 hypothetical protein GA0115256_13549 [Streptomyces sp. DconLS]SCF98224.1 hypothetical protein GA0115258_12154 [Streptomyces sp. LamerLS-31b]
MGVCDFPLMDNVCGAVDFATNPAGTVTDGLGTWIAKSAGELASSAADLAVKAVKAVKAVNKTTAIDLNAGWFRDDYELLLPIGLALTVGIFCIRLMTAAWRRDERALAQAAFGTMTGVLFSFSAIAFTIVAITVVDALSDGLFKAANTSIDGAIRRVIKVDQTGTMYGLGWGVPALVAFGCAIGGGGFSDLLAALPQDIDKEAVASAFGRTACSTQLEQDAELIAALLPEIFRDLLDAQRATSPDATLPRRRRPRPSPQEPLVMHFLVAALLWAVFFWRMPSLRHSAKQRTLCLAFAAVLGFVVAIVKPEGFFGRTRLVAQAVSYAAMLVTFPLAPDRPGYAQYLEANADSPWAVAHVAVFTVYTGLSMTAATWLFLYAARHARDGWVRTGHAFLGLDCGLDTGYSLVRLCYIALCL